MSNPTGENLRRRNVRTDVGALRAMNFTNNDVPRWNATTSMFEPMKMVSVPIDEDAIAVLLQPYVKTADIQTALGNYATSQALSTGLGAKVNSGTFTSHVNLQGAHGSLAAANSLAEFVTNEQKATARNNLGLGAAAVQGVGLAANEVAAGNHGHDTRYVMRPSAPLTNLYVQPDNLILGALNSLVFNNLAKEVNKIRLILSNANMAVAATTP